MFRGKFTGKPSSTYVNPVSVKSTPIAPLPETARDLVAVYFPSILASLNSGAPSFRLSLLPNHAIYLNVIIEDLIYMGFDALDATDSNAGIKLVERAIGGAFHADLSGGNGLPGHTSEGGIPTIWINLASFRVLYIVRNVIKTVLQYRHPSASASLDMEYGDLLSNSSSGSLTPTLTRSTAASSPTSYFEKSSPVSSSSPSTLVSNSGISQSFKMLDKDLSKVVNLYYNGKKTNILLALSDDLVIQPDVDFDCQVSDYFTALSELKMFGLDIRFREPDYMLIKMSSSSLGYVDAVRGNPGETIVHVKGRKLVQAIYPVPRVFCKRCEYDDGGRWLQKCKDHLNGTFLRRLPDDAGVGSI
ncbi:hypothetical protein HK098_001426 [Nowakowskiella sp. JEL0407]|nr:hypothetical protein HK098_001426 [Nowakowskiella sp. JEL0407]